MPDDFEHLKKTWATLGAEDPLWAVVSHDDRRNGKWDTETFLATGEATINQYHQLLIAHAAAPSTFNSVLDFGCGVGRLSLAWSKRANQVVGVDISPSMIENARKLAGTLTNVEFKLNQAETLACFQDNQFALVSSHICLQHMPWPLARKYILEFGRICQPGGWVAFQLPARAIRPASQRKAELRKWLVDHLPFGWGGAYRRWKHGTDAVFEMHFTEPEEVLRAAADAGLLPIHQQTDGSAGPGAESYIYVLRKRS